MNIREASVDFVNTLFDMLDSYKESKNFVFKESRQLRYPYHLEMDDICIRLRKITDPTTHATKTLYKCNTFGSFEFGKLLNAYINDMENVE